MGKKSNEGGGLSLPIKAASSYLFLPSYRWLVKPWIVEGAITELVGALKESGKTTFILRGIARALTRGEPFLGEPTTAGAIVYLTEQPSGVMRKDLEASGLLESPNFHVLQWHDVPGMPWQVLAAKLRKDLATLKARLVIVDTLPQFALGAGENENDSAAALASIRPLQLVAGDGVSVLIVRHERKVGGSTARAGRGATAYSGSVDVMMRIKRRGAKSGNIRIIQALSRFQETPEETVIALTENGYMKVDKAVLDLESCKKAVVEALTKKTGMTVTELQRATKKPRSTLQKALDELATKKEVRAGGDGKKGSPLRFYLMLKVVDGTNPPPENNS